MKPLFASIVLCLLALAVPASAIDTKTIPGSVCRPGYDWLTRGLFFTPPNQGDPLASPPVFGMGVNSFFMDQNSPYPINIASCSLTRDYTSNTNGFSSIKVWVRDFSASTEVSCTVLTTSPDLTQQFTSQTLHTGIPFVTTPGQGTLLTFTSTMVNQTWVRGYATVSCVVNKGDVLMTVNWAEYGPGDNN